MNNKFRLSFPDSKEFDYLLDKLFFHSKFNPIYSRTFDSFYEAIAGQEFINLSAIVLYGNEPIVGFLQNIETRLKTKPNISYFGRSAALVSSRNTKLDLLENSTKILENYIKNDKNNFLFKNCNFTGEIKVNNPNIFQTTFVENLTRRFDKVETRFSRIIDLLQEENDIITEYSKSVKSALKKNLGESQKIEIVDHNSSNKSVESAFASLQRLHLNSAGRLTRSLDSWGIQKELLISGKAFIVQLLSEGIVISSAYFMNTEYGCYYGVSASIPKIKTAQYSHLCVAQGIAHSKKIGIQSFHLGEQYSYLSHKITEKESNIEKFKSFFGGSLFVEVLLLK